MKAKQQLISKHEVPEQSKQVSKSKAKSKLPLEINLDQIFSPHPKVVETYKDTNGQFFPYDENPACLNEKRIFLYSKASKQPIKHRIVSLYRKKEFGGREVCFAQEHISTRDLFGNFLDHTRELFRYELPHIVKQMGYNPNATGIDPSQPAELGPQTIASEIESVETVYEYEFEALKPQLIKWYNEGIIREDCNFIAWVGQKKYSVSDWDSFISLPIESLVLLNKTDLDVMGLGLSKKEILEMAKQKAKEKLVKGIGESVRNSGTGRLGVR